MSLNHPSRQPAAGLGQRRLGVPALVFMIIAASAPLTVVAGGVTSNFAVTGLLGIPLSFVVLGAVLLLFSAGYSAMSQHVHNAGAFYAYIARGLGKSAGVGAAWVALLSYNAMQVGIYGLFGFALSSFIGGFSGLELPWWACALAGWAVVAVLGVNKVDLSAKVLGLLVALEFLVVIVYDAIAFGAAPEGVGGQSLAPDSLFTAGVGAALAFSIAAFMGFESGAIYNEEAKDPRTTARRATLIAIVVIAAFYAFSAWAMAVGEGAGQVVARSREFGPDLLFVFLSEHTPQWFVDLSALLFITSLLASLVAFHNVVARYFFALGREGVLPAVLARTNPRTQAPAAGSLAQSGIALVVLAVFAAAGAGHEYGPLFPVLTLFTWLTNMGAFGLVLLMALTSMAVVGYFRRHRHGHGPWTRAVAPALAAAALTVLLGMIAVNFDVLIGLEEPGVLGWLLPTIVVAAGVIGTAWARSIARTRPEVYAGIGRGGEADAEPEAEHGTTDQDSTSDQHSTTDQQSVSDQDGPDHTLAGHGAVPAPGPDPRA
ncbi:amino acid permease [Zafaria cholistanensis]|uniref:Amino acid permease n=1 Tax=Zafaria cholistanensis TaxID=1682741 RepID=A0A5A7NRG9_9MICC|nr:APC family permease [Zafaria cholistanensis]GER23156.1 amino acid permease [Zafaria cholistanensis]